MSPLFSSLWGVSAAGVLICTLCLLVWYFHDSYGINKYPGPFLAKFSYAWIFWVGITGGRSQRIHEAHIKYGPIIRISPSEVSFSDPSVYAEIHSFSSRVTKSNFYDTFGAIGVRNVFTAKSKADHVQKRRLLHPLFTAQVTREFTSQTAFYMSQLLEKWESRYVAENIEHVWFDCVPWIIFLAFDTIGDFAFGKSFGMIASGSDTVTFPDRIKSPFTIRESPQTENNTAMHTISLPHIISMREQYNYPVGLLPVWWRPAARCVLYKRVQATKTYASFVSHRVEEGLSRLPHLLESERPHDLVGRFLQRSKAENEVFLPEALASELNTILVAGTDTTRNSLSAAVYYLARSPTVQRALQVELDTHTSSCSGSIKYAEIEALPYLNACINETLRLYSPVGIGLPRAVPHPGMRLAGGEWFYGGTTVGVPIYTVHRDETLWGTRPEEFNPGRWLRLAEADADQAKPNAEEVLRAFSDGPMRCIGKHLALAQLRVMIAAIFLRFEVVLENLESPLHTEEWFVRKVTECRIGLRRRHV